MGLYVHSNKLQDLSHTVRFYWQLHRTQGQKYSQMQGIQQSAANLLFHHCQGNTSITYTPYNVLYCIIGCFKEALSKSEGNEDIKPFQLHV